MVAIFARDTREHDFDFKGYVRNYDCTCKFLIIDDVIAVHPDLFIVDVYSRKDTTNHLKCHHTYCNLLLSDTWDNVTDYSILRFLVDLYAGDMQ